jgi:hypothetical protein
MRFRSLGIALLLLVLAATAVGCADDDDATATTSPTTVESSTTSTPTPRALVVLTTVAPIVETTTSIADPDTIPLDQLAVGNCVDIADAEADPVEVGTARLRSCDEPHGLEVYFLGSLNDDPDAPYPGDEAILAGADQMCLDAFAPYVGSEYVDSSLEIAHLRPDENVWLLGDRVVRCAVQNRNLEPLTTGVQGSGL